MAMTHPHTNPDVHVEPSWMEHLPGNDLNEKLTVEISLTSEAVVPLVAPQWQGPVVGKAPGSPAWVTGWLQQSWKEGNDS